MAGYKEPVRLRKRALKDGNYSLFLDYYCEGERRYEFLKLYLTPETCAADKRRNEETMRVAQAMKARKVLEAQSRRAGFGDDDIPLLTLYDEETARRGKVNTVNTWKVVRGHLAAFLNGRNVTVRQINRRWVEEWRAWLCARPGVSANSASLYDKCVTSCLNEAVRRDIIPKSPAIGARRIKTVEVERAFLTMDELHALMNTEPPSRPDVARAFLFSCLTGLRLSDVRALRRSNLAPLPDGSLRLSFRQQKTAGLVYLDLTPEVVELMDEGDTPFPLPSLPQVNKVVGGWVAKAGITKHITFHCARHTFATLMLTEGVDLYTVSKLLGHTDVGTTQIYAKVVDKTRTEAMRRLSAAVTSNNGVPTDNENSHGTDGTVHLVRFLNHHETN